MKYHMVTLFAAEPEGRAPQGARGLKSNTTVKTDHTGIVAPRKGRVG